MNDASKQPDEYENWGIPAPRSAMIAKSLTPLKTTIPLTERARFSLDVSVKPTVVDSAEHASAQSTWPCCIHIQRDSPLDAPTHGSAASPTSSSTMDFKLAADATAAAARDALALQHLRRSSTMNSARRPIAATASAASAVVGFASPAVALSRSARGDADALVRGAPTHPLAVQSVHTNISCDALAAESAAGAHRLPPSSPIRRREAALYGSDEAAAATEVRQGCAERPLEGSTSTLISKSDAPGRRHLRGSIRGRSRATLSLERQRLRAAKAPILRRRHKFSRK